MQPERDFAILSITAAPQGDHDLVFPQWNGAENRRLDFIHQHFIVVLDQPDLRRSLDGDVLAQLQVVKFLFKAVYGVYKISYRLGAH